MVQKKVYIDLTSFLNTDFLSGIQRVVREVVVRLLKMPEFDVILFTWLSTDEKLSILSNDDFLKCYDENAISKKSIQILKKVHIEDLEKESILFDIDAVWNNCCKKRNELFPLLSQQGLIISSYIYDLIPCTNPEFWGEYLDFRFFDYVSANLRYADTLITSVKETVTKISKLTEKIQIPIPNCTVSWLGSDFKSDKNDSNVSKAAKNAVANGKYILCVGTIEPRKNHSVVLDAYDEKLASLGLNLIFAGHRGWSVDKLLTRIDTHPQKNKRLYFLENETDATISYLYKHAYAVVFPSFDEGFGLPLVEALLHGTVSIASDIPVMHEVGKQFCAYFPPNDSNSLIKIISKYIENPDLYEDCKRRVGEYKPVLWDEVAEKIKTTLISIEKDNSRENKMKDIKVEEIMQKIREEIAAKGYKENNVDFSSCNFSMDLLKQSLSEANKLYRVNLYTPIKGNNLKAFVKKVIRKIVRPIFIDSAKKQEQFNANIVRTLNEMGKYINCIEKELSTKKGN